MAIVQHFRCTACGKCCHGCLPLTLQDAFTHAGRFPLALVWSFVLKGSRAFPLISRLGVVTRLRDRRQAALLIVPTAYLPAAFPCPALGGDGLCTVQADKPSRCRTMPFYPYREEQDQTDLLQPRKGWVCDVSADAPVVYRDHRIVERMDFDAERQALLDQAPTMRVYADYVMKYMPWVVDNLAKGGPGSNAVTSLSSFLTAIKAPQASELASLQLPVLTHYAALCEPQAELAEFARNYAGWAKEMAYLAQRR